MKGALAPPTVIGFLWVRLANDPRTMCESLELSNVKDKLEASADCSPAPTCRPPKASVNTERTATIRVRFKFLAPLKTDYFIYATCGPVARIAGNNPQFTNCLASMTTHVGDGHVDQEATTRRAFTHTSYTAVMRKLVGLTRYTVFVPAIASILGALFLMAQGSISVVVAVINSVVDQTPLKDVIVEVLTAVDAILLGMVLLVIGYGLYELFVDTELDVPAWLQIKDLDDLKSKLIGVVVAIIAVVFVGVLVDSNRAGDVLAYGAGAGALVLGLGVFAWATRKPSSAEKK